MKFIHLGDLHLGKTLSDFDLIDDQRYVLKQVLEVAKKEQVDAIILAGDIYDKSIPSEKAVALLDEFLRDVAAMQLHAYVITGNHDSDERLNFGSRFFEANNIYISAKYDGELSHYVMQDQYGEVNMYLLPFVKASYVRNYYPDEKIENYDDAVRVAIEKGNVDAKARNVLVAHQFVAGRSHEVQLSYSEGLATQNVGTVEQVGVDHFDAFSYVALGHIHMAQKVDREEIRYAGAPLSYSVKEADMEHTFPLVEIMENGEVVINLVPIRPMRKLRHLVGKFEDLLAPANVSGQEDYIYITLTDEDVRENAIGIIRDIYPYTVKLDYDNSYTNDIANVDVEAIGEQRSYESLVKDFYKVVYGIEISQEELELMEEIGREAGVAYETN